MPPPISLYQLPSPLFGSIPAAFHSRSSRALVPLLSPRETNGAAAPFVSRGDRSGTNALELRLWKAAGIDPKSGEGSWYKDIGGGMGQALNVAAAMPAYRLGGEELFHPSAASPK